MYLPRGTRKPGRITLTVTDDATGTTTPVIVDFIDVVLTARSGAGPAPGAQWLTVPYDDGAEMLFSHPDVPAEGAVTVLPGGAEVFARYTDIQGGTIDVAWVGSIDVA